MFYALVAGIMLMATILFYEHKRAQDRLAAATDATPIAAPVDSSTETVTFDVANDEDGSIVAQERQLALPQEPSVRSRALLERLLSDYALPNSTHPLASGAAVDDVFLLKLPIVSPTAAADAHTGDRPVRSSRHGTDSSDAGELAVINLRGTFVDKHPSGVEVETLTIQSMLGTLHANFPQITQVRFLVDGQPHDTLAGHADLTRVYAVSDTTRATPAQTSDSGDQQ
jgi:hypothetical protein